MQSIDRRVFVAQLLSTGAALTWPSFSHADEPIAVLKILFGYPPGGVSELVTRAIGAKLTPGYAKSAIVDSRPGAAGRLIMEAVKAAPSDGSAVLVTPSSVVSMYPHVYSKLSYDPFSDITPVSTICDFVHGLAIGPSVPESVKSLADLIAWFKANPDKASVANPGEGSLPHFLTMLLSKAVGVKIEPVPYAGGPPGVRDTLGGQVPAMIASEAQFITHYREGKLRLLATSGAQRSPFSPDVPTFREQGAPNIQVSEWIGMFAPAKTPSAVIARISAAVNAALAQPDVIESYSKFAIRPAPSTPEDLGKRLKADFDFWGPTIKSTGFTPLS
jgi:tripartite-type tricarboxylate transporter receptor subunit TctC